MRSCISTRTHARARTHGAFEILLMYSQPSSCKMGFTWLAAALILIPQETSEHKEPTTYSSHRNNVGSVPFREYNYYYLVTIPYQIMTNSQI